MDNYGQNYNSHERIDTNFNIICYTDDAVLIAKTKDDLQRLLYKFNNMCKQYYMIISAAKIKQ